MQICPQHVLSIPLCQTDSSTNTRLGNMQDSFRGEDIVLKTSFTGMDNSQVIGSKNKEDMRQWIYGLTREDLPNHETQLKC